MGEITIKLNYQTAMLVLNLLNVERIRAAHSWPCSVKTQGGYEDAAERAARIHKEFVAAVEEAEFAK